ncbi:MAG: hypothetical protein HYX34_13415 [Actinobacteria bacterium]|nr:hypothetical protein [Actinomycetota bacterium]
MARLRPYAVAALVAWTLLTWTGRLGLAWSDDASTLAGKVLATVPVVAFVALAAAAGVALLRSGPVLDGAARVLAVGLAGWSVVYWAVRLPLILANDHPAGFKVVHAVLAVVAAGLAGWVMRALGGLSVAGRRRATA